MNIRPSLMGIYDYYLYTGDADFIRACYPRMVSLMDFILSRRNDHGWLEGKPGDWLFIDWADGLTKKGELSFEQLLFVRSLETMGLCAGLASDAKGAVSYRQQAASLRSKLFADFWDTKKQAFVHSRMDGQQEHTITRYTNMFGIFFGYFTPQQEEAVKEHVLLNDTVQKITTPYMRFYELGATSFWEKYDPSEKGAQHYAMYGRAFGKSLCHAWGASPLYLLGKYYLGVRPLSPGYATYSVEPVLGGLLWMEGEVPTPHGNIKVYCSGTRILVKGVKGEGVLRFHSSMKPVCKEGQPAAVDKDTYELRLEEGKE